MRKHISLEMLLALVSLTIFSAFWIQSQSKNFVVTREEGDAIHIQLNNTDETMKENHKETLQQILAMRAEIKSEMINSQSLILSRVTEVRQTMLENNKEMRDRIFDQRRGK